MRKHDWPRYANGDPKPVKTKYEDYYQCQRCGTMFVGFTFEQVDATECPQPELPGLEDLTLG